MARISMAEAVIALVLSAAMLQVTYADDYTVGDTSGWTSTGVDYTTWAANKVFEIGDNLVFNFRTGAHDVAIVTKAAYDSCNTGKSLPTFNNRTSDFDPQYHW
ncbi:hypothetical protein Patl1_13068 [Pistacia atlantica]|uniref:Uncharacterized protein n=1 Tax=Pistacia atlantica TaxID=434234 RepID=A0ACC1ASG5_9ROSI|nr:hypothetical protein Patl1_13068 [Pistacia atlantica]